MGGELPLHPVTDDRLRPGRLWHDLEAVDALPPAEGRNGQTGDDVALRCTGDLAARLRGVGMKAGMMSSSKSRSIKMPTSFPDSSTTGNVPT